MPNAANPIQGFIFSSILTPASVAPAATATPAKTNGPSAFA